MPGLLYRGCRPWRSGEATTRPGREGYGSVSTTSSLQLPDSACSSWPCAAETCQLGSARPQPRQPHASPASLVAVPRGITVNPSGPRPGWHANRPRCFPRLRRVSVQSSTRGVQYGKLPGSMHPTALCLSRSYSPLLILPDSPACIALGRGSHSSRGPGGGVGRASPDRNPVFGLAPNPAAAGAYSRGGGLVAGKALEALVGGSLPPIETGRG